jgi:chromosome segregation ATPase
MSDMKRISILSMVISFAMICSCQKQDSTAEQQLAQRKVELDAREEALDERLNAFDAKLNALDAKVKALAEKEQANLNTRTTPTAVQAQTLDPAQVQAERDKAIQQFSAQIRSQMPDDAKMKAESDRKRQSGLEKSQNQKQRKFEMSGRAIFPAPEATLPSSSPAVGAPSPTSSPAAEATSPTASPEPE